MNYLERLKKEVDHISELCDESAALQKKLSAAINRLESLELENQGFLACTLQELCEIDGVDYESFDDFIRKTGPYEPVSWSGFTAPRQVSGQLSGRAGAIARYNEAFGFDDGYQLLLNCLVAAHHIDPSSITLPNNIPDSQKVDCQRLLAIDKARADLSLALPLPAEVEEEKFCIRVRSFLATAINARHVHSPFDVRPTAAETSKLVQKLCPNNKLRSLLQKGYRTTTDWYRRHKV